MRYPYLSIGKRDADCYDVTNGDERVAALRSSFTEDDNGKRTAIPGTWIIRAEASLRQDPAMDALFNGGEAANRLHFASVTEAFAFFCSQVLA